MRILITGGSGFIGQKLAAWLLDRESLAGIEIQEILLADTAPPERRLLDLGAGFQAFDISDSSSVSLLLERPFDVVFHLAAVVSGAAEADFDLGTRVNLLGTLGLLEGLRLHGNCPVVVYASSVAVHGGEAPEVVHDGIELNPQTSYGAQKAMAELLLNDMTRRGFIDGRGLRLPTVSIRPGKPNAAASGFMSSIFREPLQGQPANCPVGGDFPVWHTAPRTVVGNLVHAAEVDGWAFGLNRCVNLPGRTDTIDQMIAAMRRVAGSEPERLISWDPDPSVELIVRGWRYHFRPEKALDLGFVADRSFEDSVKWFLEDDVARGAAS